MNVVLSTDGSKHAQFAEEVLAELVLDRESDVHLTAVTVCPSSDLHSLGIDFPEAIHEIVDQCRDHSQQILDAVQERQQSRVDQIETVILDGHPAKELLKFLEERKPDLCVVGSHGWTFSERFFLGSVSSQIAKYASCSVLVVKPHDEQFGPSQCRRIVIADDGSDDSLDAVKRFESHPISQESRIRFVSVLQNNFSLNALIPEQMGEILQAKQEAMKERFERQVAEISTRFEMVDYEIRQGSSVPHEIVNAAKDFGADLLVLGGKRKPMLERTFLGSTSLSVLNLSPCSVLIER